MSPQYFSLMRMLSIAQKMHPKTWPTTAIMQNILAIVYSLKDFGWERSLSCIISLQRTTQGNLRKTSPDRNITTGISIIHDNANNTVIPKLTPKLIVIRLRKYSSASRSSAMIKKSENRSHAGGLLTMVSKQIFMKDKKKKAVRSRKTIVQARVRKGVELY